MVGGSLALMSESERIRKGSGGDGPEAFPWKRDVCGDLKPRVSEGSVGCRNFVCSTVEPFSKVLKKIKIKVLNSREIKKGRNKSSRRT